MLSCPYFFILDIQFRGMLFHQIKDYHNSINDLQPIVDREGMKEVTREVLMKLSNSFYNLAMDHKR